MTNDLIVRGEPWAIPELIEYIWAMKPEGWTYDPRAGWTPPNKLQNFADTIKNSKDFRFDWPGDEKRPPANLSLRATRPGCLILTNIHATGPAPLSDIEFNGILHHFYRGVLQEITSEHNFDSSLLQPAIEWERDLPWETRERLRSFDDRANRVVLHAADWRRWDAFIIQAHRDEAIVRDNLEVWLIRRGWAEECCAELMGRYEIAAQLLGEYDEERARS